MSQSTAKKSRITVSLDSGGIGDRMFTANDPYVQTILVLHPGKIGKRPSAMFNRHRVFFRPEQFALLKLLAGRPEYFFAYEDIVDALAQDGHTLTAGLLEFVRMTLNERLEAVSLSRPDLVRHVVGRGYGLMLEPGEVKIAEY